MASGRPYGGPRRKLILAFDVGTTYSGISYCILDPGRVPEIKGVTKFPAHDHISGSSKIPTVIYYDRTGKVRAVGAEVMKDGIHVMAEEEQWVKAEWFKLHLRSKVGAGHDITEDIPPLPLDKTVVEVIADFLQYLLECASSYIQTTDPNGPELWKYVVRDIDFVLSHPNGWEGTEQTQMRKAAVLAGLVSDTESGHNRISFVTEGEASLHFSIHKGLPDRVMKKGEGVTVIDAGGGTIDVSSYRKSINASTDAFEEIAAPQCYFHGSVFVSIHARLFLQKFLSDSPFADDVDHIVEIFDKTTKLRFKNADEPQYVKFGATRDNDLTYNIRFGQLKLSGSDVALFFQPSVDCIVSAVLEQQRSAHVTISHIVLVGGFAASTWLFTKVKAALAPSGLNILIPESHVNKAVSDGAISFYLDHFVRTRIAKLTYGKLYSRLFDPTAADHWLRKANLFTRTLTGERELRGGFDVILPKGTQISESKEFRDNFSKVYGSREEFKSFRSSVECYRGKIPNPRWKDEDPNNFTRACSIEVDILQPPLVRAVNRKTGKHYYKFKFSIVLLFGLTELKAQVAWKENGVEKRSAAKIIYEPDTTEL